MVSHNGKLTLVGGLTNESTSHNPLATSKIRVWDSDSKQWTEPYPPMTIERAEVECASYLHYLIVASGRIRSVKEVGITVSSYRSIEILDTKSGQWFKAPPMPHNRTHTQLLVNGESLLFYAKKHWCNSSTIY